MISAFFNIATQPLKAEGTYAVQPMAALLFARCRVSLPTSL